MHALTFSPTTPNFTPILIRRHFGGLNEFRGVSFQVTLCIFPRWLYKMSSLLKKIQIQGSRIEAIEAYEIGTLRKPGFENAAVESSLTA
jgi:hypothetical protein